MNSFLTLLNNVMLIERAKVLQYSASTNQQSTAANQNRFRCSITGWWNHISLTSDPSTWTKTTGELHFLFTQVDTGLFSALVLTFIEN